MNEPKPVNPMQILSDAGINPFAVQLLCESLLKHPKPEPIEFYFPINRSDCSAWRGVKIRLEPIAFTREENMSKEVPCQCSVCSGCEPPPPVMPEELQPEEGDLDPVFCHRCGRYPRNDCGNERLECDTTGDWLCEVCSNVQNPYPR